MRSIPHSSHWGAFDAVVREGCVVEARPFARDPEPGNILASVPDAVHAPCRIDRPYVRRGWLRGERAGHPRGGDPFVPVDWDTAIRLCADELLRVRENHGAASVFGGSYGWASAGRYHHARSQLHRLLGLAGGYTGQLTNYSYAAGMTLMPHVLGTNDVIQGPVTGWPSVIAHARTLVCFGGLHAKNGLVTAGGAGQHMYRTHLRQAARAGLRIVNLSPLKGDVPDDVPADWLPIRPGADTAVMLAMAHTLIAEQRVDHAFLARATVGWEGLRDYVTGDADGVPKTPAWAQALSDLPAETIATLARDCAAAPAMLTAAWSIQRADFGEQPYWMLVALAAMLGRIGQPGCGVAFGYGSINGMGTPRPAVPSISLPASRNPANSWIPVARITDMLERPGAPYDYNGRRLTYPDTRLIWWAGGNPFHHHQDLNRLLRAWARAETIIVNEPWWTTLAKHADIVLPATTTLERNDIGASGRDRFILAMQQAIPPIAQARNDVDAFADVAEALGIRQRFSEGRDEMGWLRHLYAHAQAAAAVQDVAMPDFDAFWAAGHVELPEPERAFVAFENFARDPAAHPLDTPSGRIELSSTTIAGFGYADCPGHPVWREPKEWLGSAAPDQLHLLTSQPPTRLHSQMDPGRTAAAAKIQGREVIRLNPDDAADRALVAGTVVEVFNARGACLAGLALDADLRRGVAVLPTGAWLDPERPGEPGSRCLHGNPNVLTRDEGTSSLGQGPVAQSCLVRVRAVAGPLPPVRAHERPPIVEQP